MNKRQQLKKKKKEYVTFAYKIDIASEMKEDSIAHLVKSYFEYNTLNCKEMFEYDKEKNVLKVSKKALRHILNITGGLRLEQNCDFKFVDEIKILESKGE